MSLVALSAAMAVTAPVPAKVSTLDLALTHLEVLGISREVDRFEIEFGYTFKNVGGVAYNPSGTLPGTNDDATIQTYLGSAPGASAFAAAGYSINDAPVLQPGDSFSGSFFSNTAQLPDPLDFGQNLWLIVDLRNTGEEPERRFNNQLSVLIPTPGSTALVAGGLLLAARRRR